LEMHKYVLESAGGGYVARFNSLLEMRHCGSAWAHTLPTSKVSILYWRCSIRVKLPWLCGFLILFQFSIGDAGPAGDGALPRVRGEGFNSLLEMRGDPRRGRYAGRLAFQFSIGDAFAGFPYPVAVVPMSFNSLLEMPRQTQCRGVPSGNHQQRFQFSIGDAQYLKRRRADCTSGRSFNSLLEMRKSTAWARTSS